VVVPKIYPKTLNTLSHGGGRGLGGGQIVPHFLLMRDSRMLPLSDQLWYESDQDPDKYIRKVYDYITSHVGYGFDEDLVGLNEYVQMPYETLTKGWGDCEDSTMLMVSMLTPKGVPCRMVLGYAAGGSHRWPEVKYEGEWYIFDTTNGDVFPLRDSEKKHYVPMFYVTPHSFRPAMSPFPLYLP